MEKLLIVYIATGPYKQHFKKFHDSLKNLYPGVQKDIAMFSDDPTMFEDYEDIVYNSFVRHYPWPLVTLMKFWYVKEAITEMKAYEYTHVAYFNSNVIFRREITDKSVYLGDKLAVVRHWCLYFYSDAVVENFGNKNKNSVCYIEHPEDYWQAGLWSGPIDIVIDLCDRINKLISKDLIHRQLPSWDDESAYQVAVHELLHEGKVNVLPGEYTGALDDPRYIEKFNSYTILDLVPESICKRKS